MARVNNSSPTNLEGINMAKIDRTKGVNGIDVIDLRMVTLLLT